MPLNMDNVSFEFSGLNHVALHPTNIGIIA